MAVAGSAEVPETLRLCSTFNGFLQFRNLGGRRFYGNGRSNGELSRETNISEVTFHRWKRQFADGGERSQSDEGA